MKRLASEVLRDLEIRVARLEHSKRNFRRRPFGLRDLSRKVKDEMINDRIEHTELFGSHVKDSYEILKSYHPEEFNYESLVIRATVKTDEYTEVIYHVVSRTPLGQNLVLTTPVLAIALYYFEEDIENSLGISYP